MNSAAAGPSAASITVAETLELLEGQFTSLAQGIADDRYALWLGSGISRERLPGLDQLVLKVLGFLQERSQPGDPECPYRKALEDAVAMVTLRPEERAALDLDQVPTEWPALKYVVDGLVNRYDELLAIQVDGKEADYLAWEAVDVRGTYGSGIEPDCEHICLAILVLEGAVSEVVSANWDGLIETALAELGGDPNAVLRVVVLPEELREPDLDLTLVKFHGCAVRAAQDPPKYRASIVASRPQITEWNTKQELEPIRKKMVLLASTKRTLVIGLSAQDENIQHLFSRATEDLKWHWPADPPAHVFADEALGKNHTNILQVVYSDDYSDNARDIAAQALIRAYGKPLLIALMLFVLAAKLRAYLAEVEAPHLAPADREQLAAGLSEICRRLATPAEPDRLDFLRQLMAAQRRALSLFREGSEPVAGEARYVRIGNLSPARVKSDPDVATNGLRELAAGLALLGLGEKACSWSLSTGPVASGIAGALKVSHGGSETAVFFAANGRAALRLHREGIVDASAGDAVIIHSTEPVKAAVRSPRGRYGRSGRPASREVDMCELLKTSTDLAALEANFRQEAAL